MAALQARTVGPGEDKLVLLGIDDGIQFRNPKVRVVSGDKVEYVNELLIYQRDDLFSVQFLDASWYGDSTGCVDRLPGLLQPDIYGLLFLPLQVFVLDEAD